MESLFNLDVRVEPEHDIRVASVCFITDTGACSGEKFGNGEEVSGGNGNPDYDTPAEQCQDAGYTQSPCPEGSVSVFCPADPSYHICKCSADYNQTCTAPNQGVGKACDGKYKECCNTCPGYDYSAVPAGYVSAGECDSCDGKKYQIKCDTSLYPLSAGSCGSLGGSGGSCKDDGGTYYEACKCPLNYEWSAAARKCVCLADFKYTCAGTGYAGGSGESCDNKYRQCSCADGYYWDAAAGECLKSCANECALTSCASPYTCRLEDCSGKFCKTGCVSGYDWNATTQTCTSQCAASYKYDESNCPSASYYHCDTSTCGGKYKDCKPVLYSDDAEIFTVDGFIFAKTADLCPRKEFVQDSWNNLSKTYTTIVNGNYKYNRLYECKDQNVDDACYNLFEQVRDAAANSTVDVTQDMSCGNLTLLAGAGKSNVTINGNGHTLTFEKFEGYDFKAAVNNLNIISKDRLTSENKVFFDACDKQGAFHSVFQVGDIQDAIVTAYYLGRVKASGTVTYIKSSGYSGGRVYRYEITAQPASVVNVKNADYGKVTLMDNAVLNIKSGRDIPVHINGENTAVNLCDYNGDKLNMSWEGYVCKNVTVNSNKEIDVTWVSNSNNGKCLSYVTVNVDSSLCGKMNF